MLKLTSGPGPQRTGIFPELRASSSAPPIDLPRVVMRGALAVALGGLVLALLLGLWRARADMADEIDGAIVLARTTALIAQADRQPRALLIEGLSALQAEAGPRHLKLQLSDAAGRSLLPEVAEPPSWWLLDALAVLSNRLFPPPAPQAVGWSLTRPDGEVWRLRLIASPDSEQREALEQLVELLGLFALSALLMLAAMNWNVRRSFRPLRSLLDAIASVERQQLAPLRALPTMPIRELDAIAGALRHLADALEQAEEARRALSRQVLTLQEDERGRIARELHDELAQHLTALRVDAAWLQRRLADAPELAGVVAGMNAQCERVQLDVRALLTRLRPPGRGGLADGGEETVAGLQALLGTLVQAWAQSPGQQTRYALSFEHAGLDAALELPRDLVLTVYRISQEALTNVARHAQASAARLAVRIERTADGGLLHWSVQDDGRGLDHPAAWRRGNGLAGVKERIWAAGGDLDWAPADPASRDQPGLHLQARLAFAIAAQGAAS